VVVRAAPERGREIFELFAGMNGSMDEICADYTVEQLELIEGFLRRTSAAGRNSAAQLTD
jgi:hypothetical protein